MESPIYWQRAKRELARADPTLATIIRGARRGVALTSRGDPFQTLARSIVGQQISVKAAESVWQRLELAVGGLATPEGVAATPLDEMKNHLGFLDAPAEMTEETKENR